MTKLEELKVACDVANAAWANAAWGVANAADGADREVAWDAYAYEADREVAWAAYEAELKKTKEQTNV